MSEMDGRIGSSISLQKTDLSQLLDRLQAAGYRVVGPRRSEDAIVYDQLTDVTQLPFGWVDEQDGGRYRLHQDPTAGYFDYAVGPHSLKPFLFPPRETLLQMDRNESGWTMSHPETDSGPLAVLGVRSCDLHALAIQDRIFLEGAYQDPGYRKRREQLFLVAIQCRRAAATCFCHSYQTGPRATKGFDLALTELEDSFVIEIGSQKGAMICDVLPNARHADQNQQEEACQVSSRLLDHLERRDQEPSNPDLPRPRSMNTEGIRDLLMNNLEHPRWDEVAERCLACSNCTMVCPTCFCASVQEVADLTGDHVSRERHWDSCFTAEHSRVSSGVVRPTVRSRYRQWLTHKLASWIDQFGESGCVGCGRCITWCPVGIDLTEEVAAIRGTDT